ncbi:TPA: hypothetical protein DEP58_00405 [Patescibacteria group bacterium]|nr:hypothetical protein [Patescibacteria group bacterium]
MEQEIKNKLDAQEVKLTAIYESVEKTRKYFITMLWITSLTILLPFIGLIFLIPTFLNYTSSFEGIV